MGGAENLLGVDLLNLQLGLIDRDFDDSDYEVRQRSNTHQAAAAAASHRCTACILSKAVA